MKGYTIGRSAETKPSCSHPIHQLRTALELAHLGSEDGMLECLTNYFEMKHVPKSYSMIEKMYDIYRDSGLKRKISGDIETAFNSKLPISKKESFANQAIADLRTYIELLH